MSAKDIEMKNTRTSWMVAGGAALVIGLLVAVLAVVIKMNKTCAPESKETVRANQSEAMLAAPYRNEGGATNVPLQQQERFASRRDYADAMVAAPTAPVSAANSAASAAAAAAAASANSFRAPPQGSSSNGTVDLGANIAPQPADGMGSGPDTLTAMNASVKPFMPSGSPDRDVLPVDPSGNSMSKSQLLPSAWRSASGDAQASAANGCSGASNWSAFAPSKAGFDKFIYASRHASFGLNSRQPNPTGATRMDVMRPPVNVALSGESIPFGDSSYRNDFLSIASQNMITKSDMYA